MSGADRLVGREQVLAAASSVLSNAWVGGGQFLLISGEAGIGKTAVLAALITQAGPGSRVLRGSCWEGDGVPPYWPWSQVLRASGLPTAELGEAGWLLQPASGPADSMSAAAAADAQFRLFEAVSRCLGLLAADGPVLVVLDDLHWADEPSLRLLRFLARALTARVVLLGAYRDTEAPPELRELAGEAQQLALAGLALGEVGTLARELVGEEVPDQVTAELWRRSGGNPFFIRELTRLLLAQGSWSQPAQIPASVAETLRRRLARLSTECVRLLEWAAVAGRDIDLSLLVQDAVPAGEAAAGSLLDEARRAGVITGSSFSHDLYRETILDGLSQADRAVLNLSVGKALQGRPGPAARIAGHLVAAGAQARPDALRYSLLAAREATARLGHEDACAHYLRALQITEEPGPVGQRTEILLQLAASYDRAGKPGLAVQRLQQVIQASRAASDAVGLAAAALGMQMLGHRSGALNAELLVLLREAAQQLEEGGGPPALRSRVLAALARTQRHGLDRLPGPAEIRTAQQAVELAAAANDASALATAKLAVHDAMWAPGTAASRLPVIAEMLEAAQSCGDADLVAEAHLLRAAGLLELGDPDGRGELLNYVELAENLGHARGRWAALTRRATFAQLAGRPGIGSARRAGAGAGLGHRRAGRHRLLLHLPLCAGGSRRARAADRDGPFRPALVGVPAPAGLASRRPRRRGRGRRRPGRLQCARHPGMDGSRRTRRGGRGLLRGGLRHPAEVGLRAASPARRDPRCRGRLRVLPRRGRPPPRRPGRLARGNRCRRGALPRGPSPARAARGRRLGPAVRAGPHQAPGLSGRC